MVHTHECRKTMTATHELPTTEWTHSHALEAGDELVDTVEGAALTVTDVSDDGSVTVQVWIDQRHGQDYFTETYTEEQTRVGLRDGILETTDGKSNELATF